MLTCFAAASIVDLLFVELPAPGCLHQHLLLDAFTTSKDEHGKWFRAVSLSVNMRSILVKSKIQSKTSLN